jgi:hypothetical protein
VLPNLVRRDKWLRNPPKLGATTVEVEDWPGGLKRLRFRPAHGGQPVGEELLRLDVEVLGLTLRDHMHFTEEDRIARLLADLFKAHTLKMHENKVGQLKAKVAAIKDALSIQPDGDVAKNYRKQLRYTREQIDAEHAAQKIRETQMRELWNKIKFLRSQQGFNGAAIKMAWQKKHVDIGKEQEELKAEIAERVQEQRDELDAKIREYNARIEKLEALKGEKESKRTEALSKSDAASAARYASAIKKLDSRVNKLQRMVPSITGFNEEKQTSMMMEAYKNIRTHMPGEPYLVPVMLQDPIDDLKDCPAQEKSRRAVVKGVTYHVRVELDGQLIKNARSPHMPMVRPMPNCLIARLPSQLLDRSLAHCTNMSRSRLPPGPLSSSRIVSPSLLWCLPDRSTCTLLKGRAFRRNVWGVCLFLFRGVEGCYRRESHRTTT